LSCPVSSIGRALDPESDDQGLIQGQGNFVEIYHEIFSTNISLVPLFWQVRKLSSLRKWKATSTGKLLDSMPCTGTMRWLIELCSGKLNVAFCWDPRLKTANTSWIICIESFTIIIIILDLCNQYRAWPAIKSLLSVNAQVTLLNNSILLCTCNCI
jgi:hypothetical protein